MPLISICKSIDHILYDHAYDNTICQAMSGFVRVHEAKA